MNWRRLLTDFQKLVLAILIEGRASKTHFLWVLWLSSRCWKERRSDARWTCRIHYRLQGSFKEGKHEATHAQGALRIQAGRRGSTAQFQVASLCSDYALVWRNLPVQGFTSLQYHLGKPTIGVGTASPRS